MISFLVAQSLLLSSIAYASVKTGDSCGKLGATSTLKGYKYTCIKSGKKLVWGKGVKVSVTPQTPAPTPSSAPSETPTPSPSPVTTNAPEPTPTPSPTETKTPQDIHNLAILENSWSQVRDKKPVTESGRIIFLIDPKFPDQSRDAIKKGIDLTVSKFDYLFKTNKPIYAIFSTSLDFELAQFQKYDLMQKTYESEVTSNSILRQWRIDHYKQIDSGFKKFGSGGTMPLFNGPVEPAGYYMYFRMHPENQDPTAILMGAHETGHLLQWQMNWDFPKTIPAWWIEGQAQMIGESVASLATDFNQFERYIKSQTSPDYGGGFFSGTTNLYELEGDSVTRTEFNCAKCGTRLIYSRGKVAIHYLSGKYGNDKVINFVSTLSRTNLWWQAFEKSFGVSVDTFYTEFEAYAKWFGDYFSPGWQSSQF